MLIKYMGSANEKHVKKGEDFGGQLADPLGSDLDWDEDNKWVIDTSEAGLSDEAVELLLEVKTTDPSGKEISEFADVTDAKRVPTNLFQQLYRGLPKTQEPVAAGTEEPKSAADRKKAAEAEADDDDDTEDTAAGSPGTTVGGSTRGTRTGRGRST